IAIERLDDGARLVVSDNGRGFDPERVSKGMGIANMEARATDDGGSFEIESTAAGTTVTAVFRRRPH
ncbi:MAG: sensor histidine kinase, partial [Acidimicrobiia bacterium]